MTPTQCKMARAGLGWSAADLGERAGVPREKVARYETGVTIAAASVEAMRVALVEAGADFLQLTGKIGVAVPGGTVAIDSDKP